jgi:hypothetical protein
MEHIHATSGPHDLEGYIHTVRLNNIEISVHKLSSLSHIICALIILHASTRIYLSSFIMPSSAYLFFFARFFFYLSFLYI